MASQHGTPSNAKGFATSEYIVYPTHGVGQIIAIEDQEVAGHKLKLFVIHFAKDKMDVKVPIAKALAVGMRKLSAGDSVERALKVLYGKARVKRTMWSRRAQEYDAKINSGDLICIAEVVRDLFRSNLQPEQSYSERQLYTVALERMAREIAVINNLSETEAINLIEMHLSSKPKREFKTKKEQTNASDKAVYAA
ncbi:CarD family transcriptional regulator [Bartonella harrusi]|uniref:CarD family transcriptional regulator n=1 Tax=Bartonella harrusi TaxID=2961895 RepID=A0ABY5ESA3_9HYPH|nr:CarD family transcriptional regulator [Bartonella harrusi]UTO28262.1 CarD family transcriptional regulator [Bartonella harrusi]